jgi:hypothetical protein
MDFIKVVFGSGCGSGRQTIVDPTSTTPVYAFSDFKGQLITGEVFDLVARIQMQPD